MRWKLTVFLLLTAFLASTSVFATGITFTFANGQVTGTSPKYYEFDVMAAASASGTKLGDNQVYINYNSSAFGESVVSNGKITVTKGTLITGADAYGGQLYEITNTEDNTPARFAVTVSMISVEAAANPLSTSPSQLVHVKIQITSQSQHADISFQQSLMEGQEYEADNTTKYSPVTANDTDDSSLPVQLSSFTATAGEGVVILAWKTESEVNNLGFNIYRSLSENKDYQKINGEIIKGAGNSTSGHSYSYRDENIETMGTYYYKLENVDLNGKRKYHEPISVYIENLAPAMPVSYSLSQNFPNPFNPETEIKYQIPENGLVFIGVYNLLGQRMKTLVQKEMEAGFYSVKWTGIDDSGNKVGSGVYIIRLVTNKFSDYKKVLLLK